MTEKEKIYKRTVVCIGETLVDESKRHITPEKACERIRRYLQELRYDLDKAGGQHGTH